MKKNWYRLLALLLCLALCGCAVEPDGPTTPDSTGTTQTGPDTDDIPDRVPTRPAGAEYELELGEQGAVKVPHSVNISSVRYITSADQLPDYAALEKYNDAYFRDHALVLVMETVSSGSVQVSIQSITTNDTQAWVTLSHDAQNDVAIPVMTTWLVWAEVETGLDWQWAVKNPALDSETGES